MSQSTPDNRPSGTATSAARAVGAPNFASAVLEASRQHPVLVDFWAAWCGPCRSIGPIIERLATDYAGRADVVKVDTDAEGEIAGRYGIRSLPTLALFRDGRLVETLVGAHPERSIRAFLESHLDRPSDRERRAALDVAAAGDPEAAIGTLEHLTVAEPARLAHRLALIDVLIGSGRLTAAGERLAEARVSFAADPELASRRARLELAQVAAAEPSEDPLARAHRGAARDFLAGRHAEALDSWFDLMRRQPGFGGGAPRRALRAAFDLLGEQHALVRNGRRQMATLLH